jgi:hypothetical protein
MKSLFISLIIGWLFFFCAQKLKVDPAIPEGWKKVEAEKFMTFYLPNDMRLESEERCVECAWGSTYLNNRIRLYAEYSSWASETREDYLAKQAEYKKEMTTIDGNRAKIQSLRLENVVHEYNRTIEVRIYDSSGKPKARMSALCKAGSDLETAKKIFMTIRFH